MALVTINHDVLDLFTRFPFDLQRIILNFTFVMQMQEKYATNDLDEMAKKLCLSPYKNLENSRHWLTALLDLGVCIPHQSQELIDNGMAGPFHIAAVVRDAPLIRRLVRLRYDINAEGQYYRGTALNMMASLEDTDVNILQTLCEQGADARKYPNILTVLIEYSQSNDKIVIDALALLIKHGAPVSRVLTRVKMTKRKSNAAIIQVLLDAGADLEELDEYGETPLAAAAFAKNIKMVKALLDAGANVNGASSNVLFATVKSDYRYQHPISTDMPAILKILCCAGADTTQIDSNNDSILSYVLTFNLDSSHKQARIWRVVPSMIKVLCRFGVDANFRHHTSIRGCFGKGDTPLHIIARIPSAMPRKSFSDCVAALILYGADINSRNDAGQTPLQLAQCVYHMEVLLQHGATLDVKTETMLMGQGRKRRNLWWRHMKANGHKNFASVKFLYSVGQVCDKWNAL